MTVLLIHTIIGEGITVGAIFIAVAVIVLIVLIVCISAVSYFKNAM